MMYISWQKKCFIGFILIFSILALFCYDFKYYHYNGKVFNTYYQITIPKKYKKIDKDKILDIFSKTNNIASTFNPDSEISKINNTPTNQWINLSPELSYILKTSKTIHQQSDGYFDIATGNLINLWGFGTDKNKEFPINKDLSLAQDNSGFDKLIFNDNFTKIKKITDIKINLSSIAKGYAIDEIAQYLQSEGINDFMINLGGQIYTSGNKNKDVKGWNIGLQNPINKNRTLKVINLNNEGIATSGNYQNFFIHDKKSYSHIINPKTGYPIEHNLISVSIINKSSLLCDAYATAILAMGTEKGIEFANKYNLKAIFYIKENDKIKEVVINL